LIINVVTLASFLRVKKTPEKINLLEKNIFSSHLSQNIMKSNDKSAEKHFQLYLEHVIEGLPLETIGEIKQMEKTASFFKRKKDEEKAEDINQFLSTYKSTRNANANPAL
jgi:hypothetical protein